MNDLTLAAWLALLERRHPRAIDLGLERCGRVWSRLGSPRPGQYVITVAGTNGKGSAMAWMAALLAALGHTTASYTSPHLLAFNERLVMDGEPARDADLVRAFQAVEAAREQESLTYFEFTTLACLWLMAAAAPRYALLEVGLGGRLDTVNLVDADLAVIMPIGLDHQEFLGTDREAIGWEKAGILRPGIPLVCGESAPPQSVIARATELGCTIYLPQRDYRWRKAADEVQFSMGSHAFDLPLPPLAGPHQPGNLGAALAAVLLACPAAASESGALRAGVRTVRLPGRLQVAGRDPLLLLDVGHNPMAAAAMASHLEDAGLQGCHCVLGMLADKDVTGVVAELEAQVGHWHCAGLEGERGQTGPDLAARVKRALPGASVSQYSSVADALTAAMAGAGKAGAVLVFGSFHTVGAAMRVCC